MASTSTAKSTAWGTAITSARTAIRAGRSARNRAVTKRVLSSVSPSWPEIPTMYALKPLHPHRMPPGGRNRCTHRNRGILRKVDRRIRRYETLARHAPRSERAVSHLPYARRAPGAPVDFLQTPRTGGTQRIGRLPQIISDPGGASIRPTTPETMNEQITAIAALLLEINGKGKYTAFSISAAMYALSASGFIPVHGRKAKTRFSTSRCKTRTANGGIGTTHTPCPGDSILSFLTTLL